MAFAALLLQRPPQEILQWRESEFYLWMPLLFKKQENLFFMQALMISGTFWDPKGTAERVQKDEAVTKKPVSAADAIARAEAILRMPGSGAYLPPPSE